MLAKIPNLLMHLNCRVHDVVTSVLRNSRAVTEPPGWGRMLEFHFLHPNLVLTLCRRFLGWAEHSEVLPSGNSVCC